LKEKAEEAQQEEKGDDDEEREDGDKGFRPTKLSEAIAEGQEDDDDDGEEEGERFSDDEDGPVRYTLSACLLVIVLRCLWR